MFRNNARIALAAFCAAALSARAVVAASDTFRLTLLIGEGNSHAVSGALADIRAEAAALEAQFFTAEELARNAIPDDTMRQSSIILVDVMYAPLAQYASTRAASRRAKVYALRPDGNGGAQNLANIVFDAKIAAYFNPPSRSNIANLLRFVMARDGGLSVKYGEPARLPDSGYFHPRAPRVFETYDEYRDWYRQAGLFRANGVWVGLGDFQSYAAPGEVDSVCARLVENLEAHGMNVLPAYVSPSPSGVERMFLDSQGRRLVDMIGGFSFRFGAGEPGETPARLQKADVPIFNLIRLFTGTTLEWKASAGGLGPAEIGWQLCAPELNGLIEPTLLGGKIAVDAASSGKTCHVNRAIEEHVRALARRLEAWRRLQTTPNGNKRIAIVYYNHSQGRQNVGASYLNVFRSLETILRRLCAEGYSIRGALPGEEEIKDLVLKYGRNIGSWAPGELDELRRAGRTVEIPLADYRAWHDGLAPEYRKAVESQWGRPEDSTIMSRDGRLILPCVNLGNIVLLPQPVRGWSDNPMKTYHDPTLWPHHQYAAFYLWLQHGFKADAVVHLGTHGTHEWLPGKQAGLSRSCAPEALIQDLPNIYPYIVDNIGEGIQAKRRGRGVVIDHLTPVFTKAGAYQEYRELSVLLGEYNDALARSPELAEQKFARIKVTVETLGLDKDLGLSVVNQSATETVEHYLLELQAASMPYGLHTYGVSPTNKALEEFAVLIKERNAERDPNAFRRDLGLCGPKELDSLARSLAGRYVVSGEGNDPLRNPDAIPTGRNFHGFDPAKIPSRDAYALGVKTADEMIAKHRKEKGGYPDKIALILWSVETQRNEGAQVATALRLLGMKPVWDKNGKVTGVAPVPGAVLGRPRIDIHVQASGLFRDCFPSLIQMLDKAVREAAELKDVENFIARHSDKIRAALREEGFGEEEAGELCYIRVFSEAPGSYSTRAQELVPNSGIWDKDTDIADLFIRHASCGYGAKTWGKPMQAAYKKNLEGIKAAMHTRSSNLYMTMDNDDVFGYLGGLSMAVRRVTGSDPDILIARQENTSAPRIEDVERTLGGELRSRYLNPRWIEGMKKENYAGARAMSRFLENMWGWQVTTPSVVDAAKWQQTFEVYVEDKYRLELKAFFDRENPWARQSMTARMLEAVRKDYWKAPDAVRRTLAKEYALNVIEKGAACCDHTCNNPALNQMVATLISLPGMLTPDQTAQFRAVLAKVNGQTLEQAAEAREGLRRQLDQVTETIRKNRPPDPKAARAEKKIEGFEMEEQPKPEESPRFTSSGAPWIVTASVLTVLALALLGWWRKR
ncbi:MAG: cobaltochelatase subunit CobN [Verrucomicrobiota bacterium]|nr:cobaltochelatase subunit CobN [Verrucomicrobiota bacterium]